MSLSVRKGTVDDLDINREVLGLNLNGLWQWTFTGIDLVFFVLSRHCSYRVLPAICLFIISISCETILVITVHQGVSVPPR